jgi:hypothetical protein
MTISWNASRSKYYRDHANELTYEELAIDLTEEVYRNMNVGSYEAELVARAVDVLMDLAVEEEQGVA